MAGMINPTNAAELRAINRQARNIKANPHAREAIENYGKGGVQLPSIADSFQTSADTYKELAKGPKKGIKGAAEKAGKAIKENASKLGKFIGNHKVGAVIVGAVAAAGAAFGIYKGVQAHQNKAQAHQA